MSLPIPLPTPIADIEAFQLSLNDNVNATTPVVALFGNLYKRAADDSLYWSTLGGGEVALGAGGGGSSFSDATFDIFAAAEVTSKIEFSLTSPTAATVRTITAPNADMVLPAISSAGSPSIYINPLNVAVTVGASADNVIIGAGTAVGIAGVESVVVGADAGAALSSGDGNVCIGFEAANLLETGDNNVYVGFNAGQLGGIAAASNVGVGANTLLNATGSELVAIGTNALASATTASQCTAVGTRALRDCIIGADNVAVGYQAGLLLAGSDSVAIGSAAFQNGAAVVGCVAVGMNAGLSSIADSESVYIGLSAADLSTGATNNVAIGGNVAGALLAGSENVLIGHSAGDTLTTGGSNIVIGRTADVSAAASAYCIALGAGTIAVGSDEIRIGFQADAAGTTPHPTATCFIDGIFSASITGTVVEVTAAGQLGIAVSSRRFKDNIANMVGAERLYGLRPVNFTYKADATDALHVGLIAEEVEEVMPELVMYEAPSEENGEVDDLPYTVKYQLLVPNLLDLVQKQKVQLDAQAGQIAALDARLVAAGL